MTHLNHSFQYGKLFSKSIEPLSRHGDANVTQNEHVYAMCCRPEVAGDIISGTNINTTESYAVLNFEAASFCSFRENQRR